MYNFQGRKADACFICQEDACQRSVPWSGVVEIWVRKSLVEVITCNNANEAFAPVMALSNGNANSLVQIEHHNLQ